ncbi:restriction endonuclease subunit S [Vibrio gigantis]|uniref:restriction endonuclease subunit S n=1 Tax=Vibrio gigantis TaxID=296199 RepID=UPI001BFE843A|nr:restriction endonuclease subunit S [Vibrio gigantis]
MIPSVKSCSVSLSEICEAGLRLEAGVFNIDAKNAKKHIEDLNLSKSHLAGDFGLIKAFHCPRFKRPYVDGDDGIPFFQPSQIVEVLPEPARFLAKSFGEPEHLQVKRGQLLLTCSGTIGKLGRVTKHFENKVFSHDLIRIELKDPKYTGLVYTFLSSEMGQLLLKTSNYGAVIQHIEPDHLEDILVPIPESRTLEKLNELFDKALQCINESNELIQSARDKLLLSLGFDDFSHADICNYDNSSPVQNVSLGLQHLQGRLDASFHTPKAEAIEEHLKNEECTLLKVGDSRLSNGVFLPGRFKRVYVEKEFGIPFIGGKELGNLTPKTEKFLSLKGHSERIKSELLLKRGTILVTRSGTIGKVNLTPRHWEGCAASEHIIRITPKDDITAGYLYAWLSTSYGLEMIKRHTYGAVVDEIDDYHVSEVLVPMLSDSEVAEIGSLVVRASALRTQASELDQQAMLVLTKELKL